MVSAGCTSTWRFKDPQETNAATSVDGWTGTFPSPLTPDTWTNDNFRYSFVQPPSLPLLLYLNEALTIPPSAIDVGCLRCWPRVSVYHCSALVASCHSPHTFQLITQVRLPSQYIRRPPVEMRGSSTANQKIDTFYYDLSLCLCLCI
jgi:hypothetical protein